MVEILLYCAEVLVEVESGHPAGASIAVVAVRECHRLLGKTCTSPAIQRQPCLHSVVIQTEYVRHETLEVAEL